MNSGSNSIQQTLAKLFERHRIVFWYDPEHEFENDFEQLAIDGVEAIRVENNEFGVKYRVLREQPNTNFLLYRPIAEPDPLNNWLLDVELAHRKFRTDQVELWVDELGWLSDRIPLVESFKPFFQAAKRREAIKRKVLANDPDITVKTKMMAVCVGTDDRLEAVVEGLLNDLANNELAGFETIQKFGLEDFLWQQLERVFGYSDSARTLKDFAISLFDSGFQSAYQGKGHLAAEALLFLKRWKNDRHSAKEFETLSTECAEVLNIQTALQEADFRDLIEIDFFELCEHKVLHDLVQAVQAQTLSADEVGQWVRQRRRSHWFDRYKHLYQALEAAAAFCELLAKADFSANGFDDALGRYAQTWYLLDRHYRKFVYHRHAADQQQLLAGLAERVENLYNTNYLLAQNDSCQQWVDALEKWDTRAMPVQWQFFNREVKPFLDKGQRICVIISDAMRYEVGEELYRQIQREDRYACELSPMLSSLPSYTQLGMAALLPHETRCIDPNSNATVSLDGVNSAGTANRSKILGKATSGRGRAITEEEFLRLGRNEARELLKDNDLVYIYHNRIDHTGDKMQSEGQAFAAAEATIQDVLKLVKKLTAANAANVLVTADHGFIYQDRPLDESDYSTAEPAGDEILVKNRRFVIGHGLKERPGLKAFIAEQLGLTGGPGALIPKSINRLRVSGSGSRFVHGGATLQEVVIPLLRINKSRTSDISQVEAEILAAGSATITAGQLAISLYQSEPASEKVQPRELRVGIYSQHGDLISDEHNLVLDSRSENPREREYPLRLLLSKEADNFNGQDVLLKVQTRHGDTSRYKDYRSMRYLLRRSFTSDFDF